RVEASEEPLSATQLDWSTGARFKDPTASWTFSLAPSDLHLFVDGQLHEVAGLIEVKTLPRKTPFFLVFRQGRWADLRDWSQRHCIGFERIDVSGLPPGWSLARCREAVDDVGVRDVFPALGFSKNARLRFVGGIKVA